VNTSWDALLAAVEAFLAGEALRSPEVLVVGGRAPARRFCATIRQALELPPQPALSLVVVHLDEPPAGALPERLRQLAELGSGRLVVLLPDQPALLPLAELLRAAESASLVLREIEQRRIASAANWSVGFVLAFERDRGLVYSGERLNLARAPARTVYEHAARYAFVARLAAGRRVLDLGCGEGIGAELIARDAAQVVALDRSRAAVERARALRPRPNLEFREADALEPAAELGSFDVVCCLEVIEHMSPDQQVRLLAAIAARLAPAGIAVLSTPDPRFDAPSAFHMHGLDARALEQLAAVHFPHRQLFGNSLLVGASVRALDASPAALVDLALETAALREMPEPPDPHFLVLVASRCALPVLAPLAVADSSERLLRESRTQLRKAELLHQQALEQLEGELARLRREQASEQPGRLARLRASLHHVPGFALPPAPARGLESPATARRWQLAHDELRIRCAAVERELADVVSQPAFRALQQLYHQLCGYTPPALQFTTGAGRAAVRSADLDALVATTRALHGDFEQLRASLSRWPLRPFRLLRALGEELPPGARWLAVAWRRAADLRTVRRLRASELPPAAPPLAPDACPDLISIVLPTYDRAALLERAIRSVRAQSYANWQLIVVDDGSRDATPLLAERFEDPRIVWVRRPHRGVSAARNAGLALAEGAYVAFLDSDNVWHADFLRRHHDALSSAGEAVVASYCDLNLYRGDRREGVEGREFSEAELFHAPQVDLNALVARRSALAAAGAFDERMDKWVDYELLLRLAERGAFVHLPEVLVEYHRLAGGISRASARERPMERNLAVIRETRRRLLRVGYVLADYPAVSQTFVHREIAELERRGVDVVVYHLEDAEPALDRRPAVPAHRVDGAKQLADLARTHRRQLLHAHFAYPSATLLAWPAAERARIPFTFVGHGVDLFQHENERRGRLAEVGRSPFCKAALAVGSFHAEYLRAAGVPQAKILRGRYLLDASWTDGPPPDLARPLARVALVTRLVEKKGALEFVELARRCRDTTLRFDLWGYGPDEREIAAAAEDLPNLDVHLGAVSPAQVRRVLDASSAVLLPCKRAANGDMDGLPVILLEAAARGCLLLASRVASIPDLLESGVTGFLLKPGDLDGAEVALRQALALSTAELAALRGAALARVRREFAADPVIENLLAIWCG